MDLIAFAQIPKAANRSAALGGGHVLVSSSGEARRRILVQQPCTGIFELFSRFVDDAWLVIDREVVNIPRFFLEGGVPSVRPANPETDEPDGRFDNDVNSIAT